MVKKFIPNILTFINLSLGILSIIEVFNKNFGRGAWFIIVAALIDRYDGRIARFFNVSSEIGKELDSLADLISFGVAPAILIFVKCIFNHHDFEVIGIISAQIYIICGCYRLAKYNVSEFNGIFTGIPITIAGSILALFSLFASNNSIVIIIWSIIVMVALAYMMISKFKLKKI
ncbi:phosphatidylcholine synthase [Clostridium saccharobutylicum]|uniref:CDP-diacylglycerol--serine O-phosphatidyltransferase n=1 Tax=Clostridium saccharobutylicum TaxID=169679 RepID=UPI000983E6B0|nr:CDP-diacylglycerol--serine O-phosphatidyltransferase [Clostridium saccharobutylicum]AQS08854.1 phosphatidylcholine synthase [Clostridium saccharobutylicum]MBC2437777.1 CDP-diacylglycerol--serine O-phosphatidyltransferase [Clostridium saccharobutylicum]NSB90202.1 CDP-diacylglycerol--serine O-phosphatidyltransferase [Clostridium saccharobutylicum]NYC28798.1 CDP-diacylglycerol--serine O-phosphatidyltransferase [Clostridium saccharobutylicum]OOM14735.1 phosphatidylcholine synthase [Clostridium 